MCRIISFSVDKGGVGKTTCVINTAARLAALGKKVLAVDLDQQCNLTETLLTTPYERTLYDAFLTEGQGLPFYPLRDNLFVVPASHRMFASEGLIRKAAARRGINPFLVLGNLLEPLKEQFDFILLDTPPSDNIYMINSLYSTHEVVLVVKPEPFCVAGASNYVQMMKVARNGNPKLRVAGILFNDVDLYSVGHRKCIEAMKQAVKFNCVFDTVIRRSRYLYNASLSHQDIFSYAPGSNGAVDFEKFVNELLK